MDDPYKVLRERQALRPNCLCYGCRDRRLLLRDADKMREMLANLDNEMRERGFIVPSVRLAREALESLGKEVT